MFKKILVPLDGSQEAARALPLAAQIARTSHAGLVLLRAEIAPLEYAPGPTGPAVFSSEVLDTQLKVAHEDLEQTALMPDLEGIETEVVTLPGTAAQQIITAAHERGVDLIVMCSHDPSGLQRWIFGSVAQTVARHSSIPVLVLHKDGPLPLDSQALKERPFRVLVPLNGLPLAETILEAAAQLAASLAAPGSQAALHLLRVLHYTHPEEGHVEGEEHYNRLVEQALKDAQDYLRDVEQRLQTGDFASLNLQVTWSVVVDSDVAGRIVRVAENSEDAEGLGVAGGCDVIALATHGRNLMERWTMGSVAESVLGATKIPLLVVSAEAEEREGANA